MTQIPDDFEMPEPDWTDEDIPDEDDSQDDVEIEETNEQTYWSWRVRIFW